jgi:hypothetical protein
VQALVPKADVQNEREVRRPHKLEEGEGEYSMRASEYE